MIKLEQLSTLQYNFATDTTDNVSCNAFPGSGKSVTLAVRIKFWKDQGLFKNMKVLLLCFNNPIAREWERYNLGIDVNTSHSLGFKILKDILGTYPDVDKYKYQDLYNLSVLESKTLSSIRRRILFNEYTKSEIIDMLRDELLITGADPIVLDKSCLKIYNAWRKGINCMSNTIDYDDMLFGSFELLVANPKLKNKLFHKYDYVIIDEAQDITLFQWKLLDLVDCSNLWATGDENQDLFRFIGSDFMLWRNKAIHYGCTDFILNQSRRCPQVVEPIAQKYVPDFEVLKSNPMGSVDFSNVDNIGKAKLNKETTIICRANRPLIYVGMKLLEKDIKFQFKKDITKPIVSFLRSRTRRNTSLFVANTIFENYKDDRTNKLLANELDMSEQEVDIFETVLSLTSSSKYRNIGALIDALEKIPDSKGGVILSSIHGYKGLENNSIVLINHQQLEQGAFKGETMSPHNELMNLAFVAVTRVKQNLIFRQEDQIQEFLKK